MKTETLEAYSRGNNGSEETMQYPYLQETTGARMKDDGDAGRRSSRTHHTHVLMHILSDVQA